MLIDFIIYHGYINEDEPIDNGNTEKKRKFKICYCIPLPF